MIQVNPSFISYQTRIILEQIHPILEQKVAQIWFTIHQLHGDLKNKCLIENKDLIINTASISVLFTKNFQSYLLAPWINIQAISDHFTTIVELESGIVCTCPKQNLKKCSQISLELREATPLQAKSSSEKVMRTFAQALKENIELTLNWIEKKGSGLDPFEIYHIQKKSNPIYDIFVMPNRRKILCLNIPMSSGQQKKVSLGALLPDCKPVALLKSKRKIDDTPLSKESRTIWKYGNNPYFVPTYLNLFIQKTNDKGYYFLVQKYCNEGDLLGYYNRMYITPANQLQIMSDVTQAIFALHKKNLIHSDVKLENVLIDKLGDKIRAYLTDLAFVKPAFKEDPFSRQGTLTMFPPEVFSCVLRRLTTNEPFLNPKRDIWSLGVIFYIMKFQTNPSWIELINSHEGPLTSMLVQNVCQIFRGLSIHLRHFPPDDQLFLIQNLLLLDPQARLNAEEVLNQLEIIAKRQGIDIVKRG
jgi:hypothetical protein